MAISRSVLIVKYHAGNYGQWITLANVTNNDINLRNWKMREYQSTTTVGTTWRFPSSTVIKAKSLLIVRRLDGSGLIGVPANIPVVQTSLGPFGLAGEKIVLLNPNNLQIDELIFSNGTNLYSGYTPFQIFIPAPLTMKDAFVRRAVIDTDMAVDWEVITSSTPIFAWEWAPLTDKIPPDIVSIKPDDGATNISVDVQVKVTFNEPMFAGATLQSVTIKDANNVQLQSVHARVSGSELLIDHATFNANKLYTVNVPAQAVHDAGGNTNTNGITWSFTTILQSTDAPVANKLSFNNTNPSFAQVAGQDGAVEANAIVRVYGSAAMDTVLGTLIATATGSFGLMFNNSSSLQTVYVTAAAQGKTESSVTQLSAAVTETCSVLIVKYHSGDYGEWITLANVTNNDINLTNWKMSEYLNYNSVGSTWTFPSGTVIKAKSLLIVKRTDGSGITDAPSEIPVVQTSLSPVLPLGQEQEKIILLNPNNIQKDELIFQTEINFSWIWYSGITPFQILFDSLSPPTKADVFVRKSVTDTNTAEDWKLETGSPSNPIKAWKWTPIENSDTTPPVIVSKSPAEGATNVALDEPLRVTFNEPILAGSLINGSYIETSDGYLFASNLQASISGSELLIAHPAFSSGGTYIVTVPVHVVTDMAGNPFVNPLVWSFTTGYFPSSLPPVADKISFDNTIPASAQVSGQDGAVEGNAEVIIYNWEDHILGTAIATATGSFALTINTTVSLGPDKIYVIARAPGKDYSPPTYLTAESPISG